MEYLIQDNTIASIADAIRSTSGKNDSIATEQMGKEIQDLYNNMVKCFIYNNVTTIVLPNDLRRIGDYAFYHCSSLALTSLPESITSIGNSAFSYCSRLALTSLPESITSIGNSAFSCCSSLALTSLPESITSIGYSAFNNCSSLALTSLPESITSIGNYAFSGCDNLKTITFKGTPTIINSNAFDIYLTTINVPWAEGAVAGAPWGATNATITYNYTGEA